MSPSRLLVVAAVCAFSAACSYKPGFINEYKIDVQQGNVLTQDMVVQLKPGMTRDQVRFVLGTPLLADVFHQQRWDYIYSYREGRTGEVQSRKFSVFFDANGRLERASGDIAPGSEDDMNAPVSKTRVVDLGSLSGDASPLPEREEPGYFRRLMNSLGW